jgi:NADH dehydrogenase [ubiquinone] 1 alpha subcomplex assembly factor 7
MPTLRDHLRRRIAEEGPITVADYMGDVLGHPRLGYYMSGDPFGRDGDFITAPEISQMFGELIGLWCAIQWRAMGEPATVNLVELGPGRGTLMADVLRAGRGAEGFLESVALSLVEISPVLKGLQEETLLGAGDVRSAQSLRWLSDFSEVPDGPILVVANEFLDALPVQQFQMTPDGWRERRVGLDEDAFQFTLTGTAPAEGMIPSGLEDAEDVEDGAIIEVRPAAKAMIRDLAGRLSRQPGSALLIDYGHTQTATGDTLQAVKGHQYQDPLVDPGTADLTAHVDFGALCSAVPKAGAVVYGPVSQGNFLNSLGIVTRADALATASPAHKQEIHAGLNRLTSDEAMGRLFKVMALTSSGMASPEGFE